MTRLGMQLDYTGGFHRAVAELSDFEHAGIGMAFVPELYSFDAVSQLGYLAATNPTIEIASGILPIYSRTPTLTAMTAAGLDFVSGGRFTLGIGTSGPQVIEGFHGVRYDAPLGRTREIVDICRQVWARERLDHQGTYYQVPLPAQGGHASSRSLKILNVPVRSRIPIMLAAIGPKNVALAAEIAESWQPILFHAGLAEEVFGDSLKAGLAARDPSLPALDIAVPLAAAVGPTVGRYKDVVRAELALYVGGMGGRGSNFYNDLAVRYGFADAAATIQDLYLAGDKTAAAAAVPDELVDAVSLIGSREELVDRVAVLHAAGVTTVIVKPLAEDHAGRLKVIEELRALL